ncbi:MAG TPA: DUF3683 domain-containing protein [Candidatus Binatia bacterium]|nr:DUF3683 domain-containing protein [Candidatus Binatia bacterium]
MTPTIGPREIPFNYTSADDRQAITWLLGDDTWRKLEALRARRVTGRSARLLMRCFGELLVHRRNPFLYQELIADSRRQRQFFTSVDADLGIIESNAGDESLVLEVLATTRAYVDGFREEVVAMPHRRRRLLAILGPIVGKQNVHFDPFTLVSHATDATDWRLHLPLAVITPTDEAHVGPALAAIAAIGLHAIPRGAGTGLTGGTVPLRPDCVMINTEKLNRIHGITDEAFVLAGGRRVSAPVMRLEAGVITERAIEYAAERGLVFATDPTSAWACTIGGNIAENAGGKTAVLWGTCIDNLLAYDMAMPDGACYRIRRTDHQLRKILPSDSLTFEVRDAAGALLRTVELHGSDIRRLGLWKDITNKTLNGLPGVQKEGTDGVITSAEFILYRQYEVRATLCLEFFGPDMDEASRVILELSRAFPNDGGAVLQALEHFDDEYVRAIGYKVKAARAETPRAVLLIDVVGHTTGNVERAVARVRELLGPHRNTCLFVAKDADEAKVFWADRKRFGAIAARTNAFKLNEDVCLPLDALAEFARFCEALNVVEERHSQHTFVRRTEAVLKSVSPQPDAPWLADKIVSALALCERALANLTAAEATEVRSLAIAKSLREGLAQLLGSYEALVRDIELVYADVRSRRIVIATHMHAGDGNVHVNIPILSNDRIMMKRAEAVVDQVMEKVAALGGVCSGEHGIGVTKLKYLDPERIRDLAEYRREVDPRGTMNPGKLSDFDAITHIYTPSFNLLELEARILQHGRLEALAGKIATCVRCGKCKPNCCVFHPARGLFYHPRNKNLAIGALIEALLYESQHERAASFGMLRHLEDVADHCTICHKCLKPCPVDIDTGEVSVLEREILAAHGYKHTAPATKATLRYLESRSPAFNAAFRAGVLQLGGQVQRRLARRFGPSCAWAALRSPVPAADALTLRDVLPPCDANQALLFEPDGDVSGSVFYFPGCGSERLFGSISMAALHVLLELRTRVVVPPPFLCCGFPHRANAQSDQHGRIVLRDSIIFAQIREMFAYLDFDAVTVTCGTCREALGQIEIGKIFDAPVIDVARYAVDRGLQLDNHDRCLYHAPCHDSLDGKAPVALRRLGFEVVAVPHCCSEAGTLALSRPDITDAMLDRKAESIRAALVEHAGGREILTNCPSCIQGLGRTARLGISPQHVAVALARKLSGERWMDAFRTRAARATAIRF